MSTLNTTTYVRKLVKIVYQKEKQIQNLKRALKNRYQRHTSPFKPQQIDPELRNELLTTSEQLKGVNQQLLAMETRMIELQFGLQDETTKNAKLEEEIAGLKKKEIYNGQLIGAKDEQIEQYQRKMAQLIQKIQRSNHRQLQLTAISKKTSEQLSALRQQELRKRHEIVRYQRQVANYKGELKKRQSQSQRHKNEVNSKIEECQQLYQQLKNALNICQKQLLQINQLKETTHNLTNDKALLKKQLQEVQHSLRIKETQLQNVSDLLKMKQNQHQLASQTLKDYQEFAFQISHFIDSSHLKHCCKGSLRSSKKIIRQADSCKSRFQTTFHKMSQLQTWMDSISQKLQKMIHQQEIPCQTLQNLSIIARSFEEKLELCDLTERIERDKIQMDKEQNQFLDKLQKQCQKSYLRQRSKIVELDQVRQILKITKDVNRELMGQINKKQYIISECRKMYDQIIGNKSNPQYKNLKTLLNTKF